MRCTIAVGLFLLFGLSLTALGQATSRPTSQPAAKVGEKESLGEGLIRYFAPPSPPWNLAGTAGGDSATYINSTKDGAIQIALLPGDASVEPDIADNVAVAILKSLRSQRAAAGTTVIMPAKIERDSRFAIVIHEKYKVGSATADELHLYRSVGPRVVMLTVNTVSGDADVVTATHKVGEEVLAGAKYDRSAAK